MANRLVDDGNRGGFGEGDRGVGQVVDCEAGRKTACDQI